MNVHVDDNGGAALLEKIRRSYPRVHAVAVAEAPMVRSPSQQKDAGARLHKAAGNEDTGNDEEAGDDGNRRKMADGDGQQ